MWIYCDLLAAPRKLQLQEDAMLSPEERQLVDETALHGIVGSLYTLENPLCIVSDPKAQYRTAPEKIEGLVTATESTREESGEPVTV